MNPLSRFANLAPENAAARNGDAGNQAFTLVEIALSLGIVGFSLLALVGMFSASMKTFQSAIDSTVETMIVQRVLSDIQQVRYAEVSGTLGSRFYDAEGTLLCTGQAPPQGGFIYHAIVENCPTPFVENFYGKTISISISRNTTVQASRATQPHKVKTANFVIADLGT